MNADSQGSGDHVLVRLDARKIIRRLLLTCISIEVAFVLLDYFVNYAHWTERGPIRRMFNITREDGLASWFGITQTLMVGLTAWLVWLTRKSQRNREVSVGRWTVIGWFIVASCFTYMAVDDGATIHERLGSTFKQGLGDGDQGLGKAEPGDLEEAVANENIEARGGNVGGFPSYHWQVLFVPVFGAMGLFLLVFLWRELATMRLRLMVFAALSCLAAAVGLDFIEGLDREHPWNVYAHMADSLDFAVFARERFQVSEFEALVHFSKSIEETLEMFAMTLFWVTFLTHWVRVAPRIAFALDHRTKVAD